VATPANLSLDFSADDYAPKSGELWGSVDIVDDSELEDFEIGVRCTGNDRIFNMAGVFAKGSNFDVPFPSIESIFPITVLYIGTQITIGGKHFADYRNELDVLVGGVKVRATAQALQQ
jgi:hypothetical protein